MTAQPAAAAEVENGHRYAGDFPEPLQPDARDPSCRAGTRAGAVSAGRPTDAAGEGGAVLDVLAYGVLGAGAVLICSALAQSLPGIAQDAPGVEPVGMVDAVVFLAGVVLLGAAVRVVLGPGALTETIRGAAERIGLGSGRLGPVRSVAVGVGAGLALLMAEAALDLIPALAESTQVNDPTTAVADAPRWAGSIYYALAAPLGEEILFRGAVLLACARLLPWCTSRAQGAALVVVAGLVSSVVFWSMHVGWSAKGGAFAAIAAVILVTLALWCRSLWPGVVAHVVVNLYVGMSLTGVL